MSVGKYSPVCMQKPLDYERLGIPVDEDGYDGYGYHTETRRDRNGYTEDDYLNEYLEGIESFDFS